MSKGFRYFWTHFVSSTDIISRVVDGSLEFTFVLDTSEDLSDSLDTDSDLRFQF